MFEGFVLRWINVDDRVRLRVRIGGDGPPVVLLHRHPRTHTTWHAVAPLLVAAGHTVVCPDLPGSARICAAMAARPRLHHGPIMRRRRSGLWLRTSWDLCIGWGTSASRSSGTTGAATSLSTSRWTTPMLSTGSRSWIACRSGRPWTALTPASPLPGGTGSSSPSPRSPNVSSPPTPTPGTAPARTGSPAWARATTATTSPRSSSRAGHGRGLPRWPG